MGGVDAADERSVLVDHAAMGRAVDRFALTVTADFSAEQLLRDLAGAAVEVLGVDAAGVMGPGDGELLRWVFATTGRSIELERLQEKVQDGPCHAAALSGEVVNIADLAVEGGAWPDFQTRALALGTRAVTSIPLMARGQMWGVLDLFREAIGKLDPDQLVAAQRLATLATSYLVVDADRETARRAGEALAHRAMHDPLTGVLLRWAFLDRLEGALTRLQRHPASLAVLFLDVDGLKYVNDTYGHHAGDRLLRACADRIRAALRPQDHLARIGGDEFVVLLEGVDATQAGDVAKRILTSLACPYDPPSPDPLPSASIGIAVTADPDLTPDALISHADAAMYRAKHAGRGLYAQFEATAYQIQRARIVAHEDLMAALRTALHEDQLELHFQPILDVTQAAADPLQDPAHQKPPAARERLWGVEALVRWRHPTRGLLVAGQFIGAAERTGLIIELGEWVVRESCQQIARWDSELGPCSPRRVLVNLSTIELAHPGLPDLVAGALRTASVDPVRLTLEVTETGLLTTAATSAVDHLAGAGCGIAIDDFGTGYSSLSRLVDLRADVIKIDKSFTNALLTSPGATAIVVAILAMGKSLDRTVIVEGIEDEKQLQALRSLGCTHAQGYHLAMPQPPATLTAQLQARPPP